MKTRLWHLYAVYQWQSCSSVSEAAGSSNNVFTPILSAVLFMQMPFEINLLTPNQIYLI